jgi:hypothetical protein
MDRLSSRALAAALEVARTHGVRVSEPAVLRDRANLMVHLQPSPVVARIATTTALVRPSAPEFLARDLSVAGFLASRGAPVVPPSREILPGPHSCAGFTMTFWEYTAPAPHQQTTDAEAGSLLKQLHAVLKDYPGPLPYLNPVLGEIPQFLAYLERSGELEPAHLARLRGSAQQLALRLRDPAGPVQALHGDAHPSNLLKTTRGLLWTDFEDTCSGPVAWDVACLARNPAGGVAALAGYQAAPDREELQPYLAARELQGVLWSAVLASRFPQDRARAREWLQSWKHQA